MLYTKIKRQLRMINFTSFPNPCYVIEETRLRKNLQLIKSISEQANVEIILAFKAFALWKTFPIFKEYISHTTASSSNEATLAYDKFGSKAHTYSPTYDKNNIDEIIRCSSHITFNSFNQWNTYGLQAIKNNISCGIRINPEYSEVETPLYNPCAPGSRFGIVAKDLPNELPLGIEGFHCHTLCESDSYEMERTLKHIEKNFSKWFNQIKWINLGGGHLVTKEGYNIEHLIKVLNGLHSRYPHLHIILEPGSAFAWQTGDLSAQIIDLVENHGIKTAILNVSFSCHMPDCLEMPYQPKITGAHRVADTLTGPVDDNAKENTPNTNKYRLGGCSCLSGDFMGMWQFPKPLEIGDTLIFEDMIHYTTVKTNQFNGVAHPAIGLWTTKQESKILRTFDYNDYKNRMD